MRAKDCWLTRHIPCSLSIFAASFNDHVKERVVHSSTAKLAGMGMYCVSMASLRSACKCAWALVRDRRDGRPSVLPHLNIFYAASLSV